MTTLREAAQQALEALEASGCLAFKNVLCRCSELCKSYTVAQTLRAALAEPVQDHFPDVTKMVQKPVAWLHVPHPGNGCSPMVSLSSQREPSMYGASVPLYLKEQL